TGNGFGARVGLRTDDGRSGRRRARPDAEWRPDSRVRKMRDSKPGRRKILLELRRHATGSCSRFRGMPFMPRSDSGGDKVLFELWPVACSPALQELPSTLATGCEILC